MVFLLKGKNKMANLSRRKRLQEQLISKISLAATNTTQIDIATSPVESEIQTSSSYLTTDGSLMSREVDRWLHGWDHNATNSQSHNTTKNRVISVQRSTLTSQYGMNSNGLYLALATVVPGLRAHPNSLWNCSPSALMTLFRPAFNHLSEVCNRMRLQFQHLLTDHGAQEMFTTTLDIIMVIYAIGFVIISMYESVIIASD